LDGLFYNEILNNNKMKKLLIIFLGLVAVSCQRKEEVLGPSLDELYGEFSVLEEFSVSGSAIDFAAGEKAEFSCRFSKPVDWEIQIIGETSGAIKTISGNTKIIDQDNGIWNGSTTFLPMFKVENCMAILSVPEELYADTLTLSVAEVKVNEGFLLSDFEDGINPDWDFFIQSGADMKFFTVESDSSAQAYNYYVMGGAVNWDYLIGYIDMPASAYQVDTYPLSDNPSSVYFNTFLFKPSAINNEIVLWQFWEDDNLDGVYQPSTEDMYSLELTGLENGWQTVSVRYDDIPSLFNGAPSTPAGNGLHEPNKIINTRLLFLANPATGYSETFVDYIIFTQNQALVP
jgi:hypothetical protein